MILADGQCFYSFVVEVNAGQKAQAIQALEAWKPEVRKAGSFGVDTLDALCAKVRAMPGVKAVQPMGPRMAMPLALRIAAGLSGMTGVFSSHAGHGLITEATRASFQEWGFRWIVQKQTPGDMMATFLVIDPAEGPESTPVFVRPVSMASCGHQVDFPPDVLDGAEALLTNRVSASMERTARHLADRGKLVSLRIHSYTRYTQFDDFLPLLRLSHHLMLDDGNPAMRTTALRVGLTPPRGWPGPDAELEPTLLEMARRLDQAAGHALLHVYAFRHRQELWLIGQAGHAISHMEINPNGRACDLVIASRAQGAVCAAALRKLPEFAINADHQPATLDGLQRMTNWSFAATHHGIMVVPWTWPGPNFAVDPV